MKKDTSDRLYPVVFKVYRTNLVGHITEMAICKTESAARKRVIAIKKELTEAGKLVTGRIHYTSAWQVYYERVTF
jgi:hypothetical protein